jgi:succinate dehydrogenase/fumarate reductase flavoprotein subunit
MGYGKCVIDADVLIIGGGSAGSMAAIRAKEIDPSQKVVIFEKGDIKYSGCIPRGMDALNIVAIPGVATPEEYLKATRIACEGIVDDSPSHAMVSRAWPLMQKLERWGVFFPTDRAGNYEVLQVHPKGRFCAVMKEPELKVILARRMAELGCQVINRTMALDLLTSDGRVIGAVGMNVRHGGLVMCRAKSVILASGGTARFGLPNNGYLYGVYDFPGNTGDGYVMAYQAGAQVTGFEYTLNYYIIKDINAPLLYITLTRGAKLLNALGQEILEEHPSIKSMFAEHRKDRGPMRIKMQHLPEDKIAEIEDILFTTERPVQKRFFEGRGVDFRHSDIELWPTECFLCGGHGMTGIVVNQRAETTLPGLYAAGDVACVARGHLSGAFTFGEIAAENATTYAQKSPPLDFNPTQMARTEGKLAAIQARRGPISIQEIEYKVRRIINDYVTPPKNSYKLSQARTWMARFRRELAEMVHVADVRDVFKSLEVQNIITCADLSATASETRKESRWGFWHYRADYPEKNDGNWLKHIVLSRGEVDEDIQVTFKPVERMEMEDE